MVWNKSGAKEIIVFIYSFFASGCPKEDNGKACGFQGQDALCDTFRDSIGSECDTLRASMGSMRDTLRVTACAAPNMRLAKPKRLEASKADRAQGHAITLCRPTPKL